MLRRFVLVTLFLGAVAACTGTRTPVFPEVSVIRDYELHGVTFSARADLTVSESNVYYPRADIVWRGDEPGNRLMQVQSIFAEAADRTVGQVGGSRPVKVDIVLERFHGLSERAQFLFGGFFTVDFLMTVRDATTGAVIEPQRRVSRSMTLSGGDAAVQRENAGQTQRVIMTDFLARILREELT